MMWEYAELSPDRRDPFPKEEFIEKYMAERMQAYDGTIFFCCSPRDRERIDAFTQAAQRTGRQVSDSRVCLRETGPHNMAKATEKKALFVHHSMQEYLCEYLSASPAGERHLLIYSRRFGNGPSPQLSGFMDFWMEQGVDILDLRNIDEAAKAQDGSWTCSSNAP